MSGWKQSSAVTLVGLVGLALAACATQKSAVRNLAAHELACPEDAIAIARDEGRVYRASGCGLTVRIACHDPNESTGAQWGWADPLTAGKRAECERIIDRPATLTSAPVARNATTSFDREVAAKLLAAAVDRARTCGDPKGPRGHGTARITFSNDGSVGAIELDAPFEGTEAGRCLRRELERVSVPAYQGEPVTVRKGFDVNPA